MLFGAGQLTFEWFSATAECLARSLISARRDAQRASDSSQAVCERIAEGPVDPRLCEVRTGVTASEVVEITDFLNRTLPADGVESILRAADANAHQHGQAKPRCPLACDNGSCVAMPVRPHQCRVRCALFGHEVAEDVQTAAAGAERGLRKALQQAGWIGELYELNSALATALSHFDGDRPETGLSSPFAGCEHYSSS